MALITMAVYDTVENKRSEYTYKTLVSLSKTVDWTKHRLIVIDNNSCKTTKNILAGYEAHGWLPTIPGIQIISLDKNYGTAGAINRGWQLRKPGENAIKMDNDVVIHQAGWIEDMEEAIRRDPSIGIIGLKRKDCWENPLHDNPFYQSEIRMLPHEPGQKWMIVEYVNHVIGTCQMYSDALLNQIGYLYQPKLYGFDDSFAAVRSHLAGFVNAFIPYIDIDHIDAGDTPYQKWKEDHAGSCWEEYHKTIAEWKAGKRPIYYDPFIGTEIKEIIDKFLNK